MNFCSNLLSFSHVIRSVIGYLIVYIKHPQGRVDSPRVDSPRVDSPRVFSPRVNSPYNKRNVGYIFRFLRRNELVVILHSKGELGGPGDLVVQDRLVANTQRSSGLHLTDFPGTKVSVL